jgi:hypothetical protein
MTPAALMWRLGVASPAKLLEISDALAMYIFDPHL